MRVAAVQLNSQANKEVNLKSALEAVDEAAAAGARFVLLPEYSDYLGPDERAPAVAEPAGGPWHQAMAETARRTGVWLHSGSSRVSAGNGRVHNSSVVFAPDGSVAARYDKVHLFDVDIPDGVPHRESDTVAPGDRLVTCDVDGWRVGLSVCYDLRFPELYRAHALKGAQLMVVPAAFTFYTGRDHWEVLLRARAIENQCYVLAAGQVGTHETDGGTGRTNGRSMLVDPWGTVLATAPDTPAVITGDLDAVRVNTIRTEVPSLTNRRPDVYPR